LAVEKILSLIENFSEICRLGKQLLEANDVFVYHHPCDLTGPLRTNLRKNKLVNAVTCDLLPLIGILYG
jgi:hypothetical protein